MNVSDFNFELPQELIAQDPLKDRSSSRLLVLDRETGEAPGTVVETARDSFTVQTGRGCLKILEVQLEGKKRMDAGSFLRGVHIEEGEILCI